jgi:hypothetical protein
VGLSPQPQQFFLGGVVRRLLRQLWGLSLPFAAGDKAEEHYKAAGIHLSEAKERVAHTKGQTWPAFLIKHCQIGLSRADELISIADGRTSLAEVRAKKAKSQASTMARYRAAASGGESSEIIQQEQQREEPERPKKSCSLALRLLDYLWTFFGIDCRLAPLDVRLARQKRTFPRSQGDRTEPR